MKKISTSFITIIFLAICFNSAYSVNFAIPEVSDAINAINAIANGKILIGDANGDGQEVTPTGDVTISNSGVTAISSDVIVNADINSSAAIAYSKLNLSNSILNADINSSAAIAYSKLNLTGAVLEADLTAHNVDGLHAKRVARATWDFSEHGGSQGAIDLGVTIPANALINFAYFYTVTQVVDGGAGTGALHCEDADNLYAAADVTGNAVGTVVLGIPQNGAANMVKNIASNCNLTWTIAGADATAGKLIFFVEYTIIE